MRVKQRKKFREGTADFEVEGQHSVKVNENLSTSAHREVYSDIALF